jgi:hypothetical protein
MKNFLDFIKEATIKGNLGVPGEDPQGQGEPEYLGDIEASARQRVGGSMPHQVGGRMMQLVQSNKTLSRGKEKELEEFAEEIIRAEYPVILSDIELDIKLVRDGIDVKSFMDEEDAKKEERNKKALEKAKKEKEESEEESDEFEDESDESDESKEEESKRLKLEIDKRKIANAITQGEAKNTKRIIQLPECLEGLQRILGNANGSQMHRQLLELTDLADKMDWIIPVEDKEQMMKNAPQGMAGACSVDYADEEEKDKSAEDENVQDIIQNVLNDIQENEEADLNSMEEELSEVISSGQPTIRARGIDFVMLVHETVKGIYELISSVGIPTDAILAKQVLSQTETFADEAEDFRYGPQIAGDLRDFVNENKKADLYPNVREFVFGRIMELPAEECLKLVKGILMQTDEARNQVDDMIDDIVEQLSDYQTQTTRREAEEKFEQPEPEYSEEGEEESEIDKIIKKQAEKEIDYSLLSQDELIDMIIDANQKGDTAEVERLRSFLKFESIKVLDNELRRLNEFHSFRTKR